MKADDVEARRVQNLRSIGCAVHKARGSYVPPEVARQWLKSSQTVCFVMSASFFPLLQNDRILEEFTTKILCAFISPSISLGKCCYSQGLLQAFNFFFFNFFLAEFRDFSLTLIFLWRMLTECVNRISVTW